MKKIIELLIVILLLSSTYGQNRYEREFKVKPGKLLAVDINTGGSITIEGWDRDLVLVKADLDERDLEDYKIDIDENTRGIDINVTAERSGRGRGGVDLQIYVPTKFDLEVETMGGEISLKKVEGVTHGETMGGDVNLSNLKGKIELTTMGGDITVEDSELYGDVKTMGGEIIFQDVSGNLNGSTMGGDVVYRDITKKKSKMEGEEVRISTMGGEIDVDSAPSGANVSTMGGDIHIKYAAKYVKAKTMGGDIDIDEVDGGVKASTMGGDITITMIGDPDQGDREIDLSSKGGDIMVTLPKGLSIEFDIKLTYTKKSSEDYEIICDFPITIKESEEWDYSQGSARKYILGTGKVSGGKNRIQIDTINGDIIIKKGSK